MLLSSGLLGLYYHLAGGPSAMPKIVAAATLYAYVFFFAVGLGIPADPPAPLCSLQTPLSSLPGATIEPATLPDRPLHPIWGT